MRCHKFGGPCILNINYNLEQLLRLKHSVSMLPVAKDALSVSGRQPAVLHTEISNVFEE